VEVEDHGIGVPDQEKRHVFDRFFRGIDPRVRETRGAGIGLALVKHAAEAHGGRVEVLDTPGGGATFRIVMPLAQNGGR
jgi:two-component system OmpR family sensor kinase